MTDTQQQPSDEQILAFWNQRFNGCERTVEASIVNFARMIEAAVIAAQRPDRAISDGAQNFACYLIDHCEGKTVYEESVGAWLGQMLATPQYSAPAQSGEINQCDGCRVKAPLTERGIHRYTDGSLIGCTANRYAAPAQADSAPLAQPQPVGWLRSYRSYNDSETDTTGIMVEKFHKNAEYAAEHPDENMPLYAAPIAPTPAVQSDDARQAIKLAISALTDAIAHMDSELTEDIVSARAGLRAVLALNAAAIVPTADALPAASAQSGEPVYAYIYEYETAFGLHRQLEPGTYNGADPTRTVKVYAAPTPIAPTADAVQGQSLPVLDELERSCVQTAIDSVLEKQPPGWPVVVDTLKRILSVAPQPAAPEPHALRFGQGHYYNGVNYAEYPGPSTLSIEEPAKDSE